MDELQKLITQMLEGELSEREMRRLESLIESDEEARRLYVEQCRMHSLMDMDPEIQNALEKAEQIDIAVEEKPGEPSFARRFVSQVSLVAASVAIVAIGMITVMNFSPQNDDVFQETIASESSPETVYERAEFPGEGSLKRPPTNFATIAPGLVDGEEVSFNRDIRPILSDNCFHCHGPDANTRKAELRLDLEGYAFKPHGEYAAAIIPGDAENSPLYQRITSPLKSEVMPPPDSHKTLSEDEKRLIEKWIEEGAQWEGHWAFEEPRKVRPPQSDWGNGEIDSFVAEKHREQGLKPNPEADKATLARRLALDLTGLPPSPERVKRFIEDDSEGAYSNYVDELLADSSYGEHQARFWLDAARYADTHGLHLDNYREIWPYRDWVIKAFNDNKPYDEFTVEQIAGDLLPEPSIDQIIATGFNRCNPTTSEGGAIDDEYKAIYAKDRVETTSTVFLGLTMGCASCHDHKFDPISMRDFYEFSAFFNNLDGPIMDGNSRDTKPNILIPDENYADLWEEVRDVYEAMGGDIEALKKEKQDEFETWYQTDAEIEFPEEIEEETAAARWVATDSKKAGNEQVRTDADTLEQKLAVISGELEQLEMDTPFTLRIAYQGIDLENDDEQLILSKFDGEKGIRISLLGGAVVLKDRLRARVELISSFSKGEMLSVTTRVNRYTGPRRNVSGNLVVSYDGSGGLTGLSIGAKVSWRSEVRMPIDKDLVVDNLQGDFGNEAPLKVGVVPVKEGEKWAASRIAYFDRTVPLYVFRHYSQGDNLRDAWSKKVEDRGNKEKNTLKQFYLEMVDDELRELMYGRDEYANKYHIAYETGVVSLVMREKEGDAFAHILDRGEYDKPGERVYPDLPSALGKLGDDEPRDRMSLARWLVSDENPLTARVTVNRVWQNLFGIGLVKTTEDFGIMGENPTHPELLDWLAVDFRENGWDLKRLIKQIVMSATYKQNSRIEKKEYEIDPENRYLARGARYRLDGEALRDQALFVSGALESTIGGPPVKPYQPKGIWDAVAYSGSNTRFYYEGEGEELYRRSLYTFWKRTAPPPNMVMFDAPSRENCSVRRERTNTPLQALTLMNDPQYVEASRLLAQRALREAGNSAEEQIQYMYRLAFGSEAPRMHQDALGDSFERFEDSFEGNPSDAKELIKVGYSKPMETADPVYLASLTMVASQIMNLDSFLNKN